MEAYCYIQKRGECMFKKVGILFSILILTTTPAFAHVINETNLLEDLSITEAAQEVVLLSALGVIPSQDMEQTFRPLDTLTAWDLAGWIGYYNRLEGKTLNELSKAAVEEGLISTIEGNATYSLVNEAFFLGELQLENPNEQLTHDEFAKFVAAHVHKKVNGLSLMDKAGFMSGPTGVIERVERKTKKTPKGENVNVYQLTIDGKLFELGLHPRAITDSVDPLVWQGQHIAESWYGSNFDTDTARHLHQDEDKASNEQPVGISEDTVADIALQFIVIGDRSETPALQAEEKAFTEEQIPQVVETAKLDEQLSSLTTQPKSVEGSSISTTNKSGFLAIGIVLIGGLLAFGFHKRKNSLK